MGLVKSGNLNLSAPPEVAGPVQIRVIASDGPLAPHDPHGRSAEMTFDWHVGTNAVYGRLFSDKDQDGLQDPDENGS